MSDMLSTAGLTRDPIATLPQKPQRVTCLACMGAGHGFVTMHGRQVRMTCEECGGEGKVVQK